MPSGPDPWRVCTSFMHCLQISSPQGGCPFLGIVQKGRAAPGMQSRFLHKGCPSQQVPSPAEKGGEEPGRAKAAEPGSGPAWPAHPQEASVVFHPWQACSPGPVLLSPLTPNIPPHTQAAKWHSGPDGEGQEGGPHTKTHRYQ